MCDSYSTKPWLSTQAEANQAIEKQFLAMWRRKKVRLRDLHRAKAALVSLCSSSLQELERKKLLKDKKLMRRDGASLLQLPNWRSVVD